MRDIRFRIWDRNNEVFVFPDVLELNAGVEYQQFTGLRDKNGKDIYEGDIVKHTLWDEKHEIVPVEWDDEGTGWKPFNAWARSFPTPPDMIEIVGHMDGIRKIIKEKP